MQITGWGYTKSPIMDNDNFLLNDAKKSRFLRVAYVQDITTKNDRTALGCNLDETKVICGYNFTSVLNSDFLPIFCGF